MVKDFDSVSDGSGFSLAYAGRTRAAGRMENPSRFRRRTGTTACGRSHAWDGDAERAEGHGGGPWKQFVGAVSGWRHGDARGWTRTA